MRVLRPALILLVATLMLPWGAFSGHLAAMAPAQAQGGAEPVALPHDDPDGTRIGAMPKRCRTAILTGSPCASDAVISHAATACGTPSARPGWPLTAAIRLEDALPATDPDPPRTC